MAFELRPYQADAIRAAYAHWYGGGINPLAALATGTGKSLVIAWLIRDILQRWPDVRIVMAVHVQELIVQNLEHLTALWPDAPVGVNAAALGRRDWEEQIIFAQIQSVFKRPKKLGRINLMIVDECHLIPRSGFGMYQLTIGALRDINPDMAIAGFTATPFRLDSGRLDSGDGAIFDSVVFDYGIGQAIRDGYLAPLRSKATRTQIDVSGVGKRGGEFIENQLQAAVDTPEIVKAACAEIIKLGAERKCWLVFCAGIEHAEHVRDTMREHGVSCEMVTGKTPQDERERIFAAFKDGQIKCVTSVGVMTTGSNIPRIDLLAMLRPTMSTGLYVQMVGRGARLFPGKTDCLVLDFAENVRRHGPVDAVSVKIKAPGDGEAPTKECPECHEVNALGVTECACCGYEFPAREIKHARTADETPLLSTQLAQWMPVTHVSYAIHFKRSDPSAPATLRVSYLCGLSPYDEWLAFGRPGFAGEITAGWWRTHGGPLPTPSNAAEAAVRWRELSLPLAIRARKDGQYWRITDRQFARRELEFNDEIAF